MRKFEIGQPLPLPLLTAPGYELCRSTFNEAFFDLVYWITGSEKDLIPVFTKSKLQYGLFVANSVPFFIIDFKGKGWNFDVSLNIKKMMDDQVDAWLNTEANVINMYLCDCRTNELLGMRLISIEKQVAEKIKDALEQQDEKYETSADVDGSINVIATSFTTADMIGKTKMYAL